MLGHPSVLSSLFLVAVSSTCGSYPVLSYFVPRVWLFAHKVIKSSWLVLFTRSAFVLLSGSEIFCFPLNKLDFYSTLFLVLVCLSRLVLRNCNAYLSGASNTWPIFCSRMALRMSTV